MSLAVSDSLVESVRARVCVRVRAVVPIERGRLGPL